MNIYDEQEIDVEIYDLLSFSPYKTSGWFYRNFLRILS